MIIDFHTHIFPENIAANAVSFLSTKAKIQAFTNACIDGLLKSMDEAGISISINMPVATTAKQISSINHWCASLANNRIASFAAYHPAINDISLIREIRKTGFIGIKLHPEFQNFSPDDEKLRPLWDACVENNLFVLFHAGADFAFSPPFKSSPANFARLYKSVPDLKMILAHFGSWRMWNELENEIIGLPIYLDTSFTLGFIEDELFLSLSRKHGVEKILFGSDSPWRDQKTELQKISALPFSKEEKEKILWQNAAKLLGITNLPRAVNSNTDL